MTPIYIIGHKNPDMDSVCSVFAYAKLKKALGFNNYVAARCGNSNARIDKVFNKFNAQLPIFVGDVRLKAKDVMRSEYVSLPQDASCYSVMDTIDKFDLRTIPLLDDNKKLIGEVSVFDLGEFFIPRPREPKQVRHIRATLNDVIKTLNATIHTAFNPEENEDMFVRIGAMEVSSFGSFITEENTPPEENLIVVGDRFDIQIKAIQMGVRGIIITGGYEIDPSVLEMAKSKKISVISCPYDSATTALLVRMATRALPLVRKDFVTVGRDFLLSKISLQIKKFFGKTVFVCDSEGKLEGVFTNTDLLDLPKPKLILLDHNEFSQSVIGAEEADILEIIDHHRIGNATTATPILFLNEPVGSTCTIISRMYNRFAICPDKQTASLLLCGIISDTLNLRSPTTSNDDRIELERLCKIAEIDHNELADFIFGEGSIISQNQPENVILADCKTYTDDEFSYSVSQVEELDFANFYAKIEDLRTVLEEYRKKNNLLFSALFVTNVIMQDSILMVVGNEDFISRIGYNKDNERNVFELPKTVSRKKQLIPYLSALVKEFQV